MRLKRRFKRDRELAKEDSERYKAARRARLIAAQGTLEHASSSGPAAAALKPAAIESGQPAPSLPPSPRPASYVSSVAEVVLQARRARLGARMNARTDQPAGPGLDSPTRRRAGFLAVPTSQRMTLQFSDLTATVTSKRRSIIKQVSGYVSPGQLTAVMGSSGSGKSTLLKMLTMQRDHMTGIQLNGSFHINGHSMDDGLRRAYKQRSGYMSQLGQSYTTGLTVRENLVYAALLRLPGSMRLAEKLERVGVFLEIVRLRKCADTQVLGSESGGCSGGQKRLLALAIEMIALPNLLLLDEPTSGLDSHSSMEVVSVLRSYCDTHRSVLVTIHQPRKEVLALFSRIMLMHNGSVALRSSPDKVVECVMTLLPLLKWRPVASVNPADVLIDIMTAYPADVKRSSAGGKTMDDVSAQLGTLFVEAMQHAPRPPDLHSDPLPPIRPQASTLCEKLRHLLVVLQALESRTLSQQSCVGLYQGTFRMLLTGICYGSLFYQTTYMYSLLSCLFIMLKNAGNVWGILVTGSFFQPHNSPYTLEVGARAFSPTLYMFSRYIHYTIFSLISVIPATALFYFLTFTPNISIIRYGYMVLFVLLDTQALIGMSFLCSSLIMLAGGSAQTAFNLSNAVLEALAVFAGLYILFGDTTWAWRWLFYLSYSYDSFRAMCRIALQGFLVPRDQCTPGDTSCLIFRSGDAILEELGYADVNLVHMAGFLVLRCTVTMALASIVLELTARGFKLKRWLLHIWRGHNESMEQQTGSASVDKVARLLDADSTFMRSASRHALSAADASRAVELICMCVAEGDQQHEVSLHHDRLKTAWRGALHKMIRTMTELPSDSVPDGADFMLDSSDETLMDDADPKSVPSMPSAPRAHRIVDVEVTMTSSTALPA